MIPKVSIIILNWNGKTDTLECLNSLRQLQYVNYEVIVIDNGSSDDSVKCIQQQFPYVTILQNEGNLGFVVGNNLGIRDALASGSDYVLLLNNDTLVEPSFLTALIIIAEKYADIGMLNPVIYFANPEDTVPSEDTFWFCAGKINWKSGIAHHITKLDLAEYFQGYDDIIHTDFVTGCALLAKTEVIQKIGLLDPRFFIYYEDADWSLRCQKAGWKIAVVPTAKIWHKVSAATPSYQAYIWGHRNLILFLWKHSSLFQFLFRFRRSVYKCLHEFTWHREKSLGKAAMHGLWSAITLQFGKKYREMPGWMLRFIDRYKGYFLKLFGREML